jgi:HlyD family secretion protein
MTVDDEWDWATTEAVERFQDERGLDQDGTLEKGQVVFRSGPTRIGESKAVEGQAVAPGAQLAELSSTVRRVTVDLDATRQGLAREGDKVTVELPTGGTADGRILEVGKVAEQSGEEGSDPTIEVTIELRGKAARGTGLDQAPVDVGFAVQRADDVLAVPIKALLARQGGGFAVEVVDRGGTHRFVDVDPGLYADDYVEVEGDLQEGETVVTAKWAPSWSWPTCASRIPGPSTSCTASRSPSTRASWRRSSGRRARASRRCCTSWGRSSGRRAASCASRARTSRG